MSRTAGGHHPPADAGLPRSRLQGQERGPAPQPGEVGDGRITTRVKTRYEESALLMESALYFIVGYRQNPKTSWM